VSQGELLTSANVKVKYGRKVVIKVYKLGEIRELNADRMVVKNNLKFEVVHGDKVYNYDEKYGKVRLERAFDSVSLTRIKDRIERLKEAYSNAREIKLVDYVKQHYPDEFEKITKDPFKWVLEKTAYIPGHEKEKLAVFLSVLTSRLYEVDGLARVHLMLVGGLSEQIVHSVLRFLEGTNILYKIPKFTRNTPMELGDMDASGKIFYVGGVTEGAVTNLGVLMTDNGLSVARVVRTREGFETIRFEIKNEPVVITTKLFNHIKNPIRKWWLLNRFLIVYTEKTDPKTVSEPNDTVDEKDRLVFLAYLMSRPVMAKTGHLAYNGFESILFALNEITGNSFFRTLEIFRNLVRAVAIAKGKTVADIEDLDFVLKYFGKELIYNQARVLEPEAEVIKAMPDNDRFTTRDVVNALKVSPDEAKEFLADLDEFGYIDSFRDKMKVYELTEKAKELKRLLEGDIDVIIKHASDNKYKPPEQRLRQILGYIFNRH
jgi:hypothetical protein